MTTRPRRTNTPSATPPDSSRQCLRVNLLRARASTGLSQAELARRTGLSRPVISLLEQGRANPTLAVLDRISAAVGSTTAGLLRQRTSNDDTRFSESGRKPSLAHWLASPPPGSKTAAARDFGVDLTLIAANLRLTPAQRLRRLMEFSTDLEMIRDALDRGRSKRRRGA